MVTGLGSVFPPSFTLLGVVVVPGVSELSKLSLFFKALCCSVVVVMVVVVVTEVVVVVVGLGKASWCRTGRVRIISRGVRTLIC